jgi:hypothetical protein
VKNKKPKIVNETILLSDGFEVIPGFYSSMFEWCEMDGIVTDLDILFWQPLPPPPEDLK